MQKIKIWKEDLEKLLLEGKSTQQIAEIYGCSRATVANKINEFGLKFPEKKPPPDRWGDNNPFKKAMLANPLKIEEHREAGRRSWLIEGRREKFQETIQPKLILYGDITKAFWNRFLKNAEARGIEVKVCVEEVWELFLNQHKKCALSGQDLVFLISRDKTTASIDRIDSNKIYTLDNIQIVHKYINVIKNSMSNKDFINLCCSVAKYKGKDYEITK